jgi:hypothetical protein
LKDNGDLLQLSVFKVSLIMSWILPFSADIRNPAASGNFAESYLLLYEI